MKGRDPRVTEGAAAEDKRPVGAVNLSLRLVARQQPSKRLRVSPEFARASRATRRPIDQLRVARERRKLAEHRLAGRAA
jgi:hypothetical protein